MTRAELEKLLRENVRSLSDTELAELLALARALRQAKEHAPISPLSGTGRLPRKLGLLRHAAFEKADDFTMSDEELLRS